MAAVSTLREGCVNSKICVHIDPNPRSHFDLLLSTCRMEGRVLPFVSYWTVQHFTAGKINTSLWRGKHFSFRLVYKALNFRHVCFKLSSIKTFCCVLHFKTTTFIAIEPVSHSGCQGIRLLRKTYQEQVVCIMWRSVTTRWFSLALQSTIKIYIDIFFF
jgi:hypothetical protein